MTSVLNHKWETENRYQGKSESTLSSLVMFFFREIRFCRKKSEKKSFQSARSAQSAQSPRSAVCMVCVLG